MLIDCRVNVKIALKMCSTYHESAVASRADATYAQIFHQEAKLQAPTSEKP